MFGYIEGKQMGTNKIKSKTKPIFGLEDSQSEQYPFEIEEADIDLKIKKQKTRQFSKRYESSG